MFLDVKTFACVTKKGKRDLETQSLLRQSTPTFVHVCVKDDDETRESSANQGQRDLGLCSEFEICWPPKDDGCVGLWAKVTPGAVLRRWVWSHPSHPAFGARCTGGLRICSTGAAAATKINQQDEIASRPSGPDLLIF